MHAWLAQIYGTNGAGGSDDIEKTAQSMLVEKLADAEGIDISNLTEEQLAQLAMELMPEEGQQQLQQGQQQPMAGVPGAGGQQQVQQPGAGQQPMGGQPGGQQMGGQQAPMAGQQPQQGMVAQAGGEAPSEEEVDITKEAQAKFEEADFLGRVMAHAFTQETEKIASAKTAGAGEVASRALGAARQFGGQAASKAQQVGGQVAQHVKSNKGMYGAGAAGAAGGFAAGRMSKEASIIMTKLATIRAGEILAENGIDPNSVNLQPQQTQQRQAAPAAQAQGQQPVSQVAQPRQEVQQAVDQQAVEMLKAAGFTFQE